MSPNSNSKSKYRKKRCERLTEKQEKFCQFYIDTDGVAAEAYRMAYNTKDMQPGSIYTAAWRLLEDAKITQRIDEIRAERAKASRVERAKVEKVLMDIVTADSNDLYIVDAISGKIKLKTPNQLPKNVRNALKKIKNNRGVVEYEFNGKVEAARLLGSWNGWDAPKEINVTNGDLSELGLDLGDFDMLDEDEEN